MADPIDINEARQLLTPVVGCYAERIRIGEPTNRDRLVAWVLNHLGHALDEIEQLREECHGRRFDPNLVDENKQLRAELAEAHEALTAARTEVVQLRSELAEHYPVAIAARAMMNDEASLAYLRDISDAIGNATTEGRLAYLPPRLRGGEADRG